MFGRIIRSCKALFKQYYLNFIIEFVRRQTNETTHTLAKKTTLLVLYLQ